MSKKSKTETEVMMYPRYGSDYPLDPLTYDELERAVSILHENENFTAALRFVDITLKEPTKESLRFVR